MPYNANIPQPGDQLSQSQSDLLNNFQALQTLIDINHIDFASPDQGKHKWVTFPVQSAAPPIAFNAGELGLYSFLNPTTNQNELYINKTNQVTVTQIPTTASILSVNSNPGLSVPGWTYLPSGILIKWGSGTANGSTNAIFPVSANIPVFTNVMNMSVTTAYNNTSDGDGFVRLSSFTNVGFNVYGSARTTVSTKSVLFQYMAIGY
jgi:hypothetical protein